MTIGGDVEAQHTHDRDTKDETVKAYNAEILQNEEIHFDWLEAQFDQVIQMGIPNYLTEQTD